MSVFLFICLYVCLSLLTLATCDHFNNPGSMCIKQVKKPASKPFFSKLISLSFYQTFCLYACLSICLSVSCFPLQHATCNHRSKPGSVYIEQIKKPAFKPFFSKLNSYVFLSICLSVYLSFSLAICNHQYSLLRNLK